MWHLYPNETPPDIPEDEDFGVEYEVRYRLPNGKVEAMITEWLWERQWNCIYPVIQWRNYNPIIKFPKQDRIESQFNCRKECLMKIIEEPWVDFDNSETVALSLEKDEQYTISEFIELLKSAQEKFGDKKILIHDMNSNTIGGFSHIYLHHGFDEREKYGEDYYEDDSICIYG